MIIPRGLPKKEALGNEDHTHTPNQNARAHKMRCVTYLTIPSYTNFPSYTNYTPYTNSPSYTNYTSYSYTNCSSYTNYSSYINYSSYTNYSSHTNCFFIAYELGIAHELSIVYELFTVFTTLHPEACHVPRRPPPKGRRAGRRRLGAPRGRGGRRGGGAPIWRLRAVSPLAQGAPTGPV